jgi:hypothetical protein
MNRITTHAELAISGTIPTISDEWLIITTRGMPSDGSSRTTSPFLLQNDPHILINN